MPLVLIIISHKKSKPSIHSSLDDYRVLSPIKSLEDLRIGEKKFQGSIWQHNNFFG